MGLNYSVFRLPIATNALEVDVDGLNKCIKSSTIKDVAGTARAQELQNSITTCIVNNVRVRINPNSTEYQPISYLGPVPQMDKNGNIIKKPTYTLPEPTDCMKALDIAQHEHFDTETEMILANPENMVKHDIAMPIIVLIVAIIVIYLLKK